MSAATITKTIFLETDADTVWAFLTDKDKLAQWFHPAESNLAEGRDYALVETAEDGSTVRKCWGTVVEADRPEKLVYTFTVEPLGGAMTTVTWLIRETHGGVCLTLIHEGVAAAAGEGALPLLMALDAGWDAHLGRLRGVAR